MKLVRSTASISKLVFLSILSPELVLTLNNCSSNSARHLNPLEKDRPKTTVFKKSYDVSILNQDLSAFESTFQPTFDLAVHILKDSELGWDDIKEQVINAKKAFAAAGVQVRLLFARHVDLTTKTSNSPINQILGYPEIVSAHHDFYINIEKQKNALHPNAIELFRRVIKPYPVSERRIDVIFTDPLNFTYLEADEHKRLQQKTFKVAAVSLPGYVYQDRLPADLRGLILFHRAKHPSVLAHELGHKLINVSHEGLSICPSFAGSKIPGLMGYSGDTKIYSGQTGRFHRERLLKSPFIYRYSDDQKKLIVLSLKSRPALAKTD